MTMRSFGFVVVLAIALMGVVEANKYGDAVLMSEVSALVLERGKYTTARRGRPIPQVSCVGGDACGSSYEPGVVACTQIGSNGIDAQWECKATLDKNVMLGLTVVSCEGYSSPDDQYILRGSCGVEIDLQYTPEARRNGLGGGRIYNGHSNSTSLWESIGTFFFICIMIMIICCLCNCGTRMPPPPVSGPVPPGAAVPPGAMPPPPPYYDDGSWGYGWRPRWSYWGPSWSNWGWAPWSWGAPWGWGGGSHVHYHSSSPWFSSSSSGSSPWFSGRSSGSSSSSTYTSTGFGGSRRR